MHLNLVLLKPLAYNGDGVYRRFTGTVFRSPWLPLFIFNRIRKIGRIVKM
jgi:hypothetical protein